jgi:hypothetical protein
MKSTPSEEKNKNTKSRDKGDLSHRKQDPRVPLGRSSLENSETVEHKGSSFGKKVYASPHNEFTTGRKIHTPVTQERILVKEQRLRKKETPRKSPTPSKKITHNRNCDDREERIHLLEAKMQDLLQQKRKTDQKNEVLQKENNKLKNKLKEAERFNNRKKWSSKDEEEFQKNRKLRLEDQTLVKATLCEHLKKVDYTYDIKNQWAKSNKTHFGLSLPRHFQRAEELNIRDKLNEEREAAVMETHGAPTPTAKKLSYSDKKKNRRSSILRSGLFCGIMSPLRG